MRILDRYLIRHLLIPITFCAATLVFLVLIADVFDHLSDFVRNQTPLLSILKYYLFSIPFASVETIPWATLLGTIYLLVTANAHNEILAMKASGISITKITRPLLYIGFFIGVLSFMVSDRLLPTTLRLASAIRENEITRKSQAEPSEEAVMQNLTYYGAGNRLYYAKSFHPKEKRFEELIVLFFNETQNVRRKIFSRSAQWQGTAWKLFEVTDYQTNNHGKMLGEPRAYPEALYPELTDPPQEFVKASREQHFLTYQELKKLISRLEENHLQSFAERAALHDKLSRPWHGLVMMLVSIPLLTVSQTRKVFALNLLLLLGLVFGFHVLGAVTMALGKTATLPPALAAWSDTFLFTAGSVFFHDRANY